MTTKTKVHIINHTHWDREWFLTSVYTSQWIPGLIEKIEELVSQNRDFRYLFDGQTLVVEDLISIRPSYESRVRALISSDNLIIGPYYCQPDWQLSGGETLVRNLALGIQDTVAHGGQVTPGWLVDTFGHISQAPQIHQLFGIDSVFVWRGVPLLAPFFEWRGSDGQTLFSVDLFGGYRNLYGITLVPEIAVDRLEQETARLIPYYPLGDMPLFDGYDLEDNPEDPLRFFNQVEDLPDLVELREATSTSFIEAVRDKAAASASTPTISGELVSGKYGATFPGTYSTRTYQKISAYDCEKLLYLTCEPLAALAHFSGQPFAAERYQQWTRILLQNAVHDCICGVSIDEVHEKMDVLYQRVFDAAVEDTKQSLQVLLRDFKAGTYAVSTNPFAAEQWIEQDDALFCVKSDGMGIWPVKSVHPLTVPHTPLDSFRWENDHYEAVLDVKTGRLQLTQGTVGELLVYQEEGDSYSDDMGNYLGQILIEGSAILEKEGPDYRVVRLAGEFHDAERDLQIKTVIRLTFDQSPLIKWSIDLDSWGGDFRIEMKFVPGIDDHGDEVVVGMPFDQLSRSMVDRDLLPRKIEGDLGQIFMGQRELNEIRTYPMHNFVGFQGSDRAAAVMARGNRSYQAFEDGTLLITLRRSVEWVTKVNLRNRIGDAGPLFYVPEARCERPVQHEIGFYCGDDRLDSQPFQTMLQAFHRVPLLVDKKGTGTQESGSFGQIPLPLSGLTIQNERLIGRFYNPLPSEIDLDHSITQTDVWGKALGQIKRVPAKKVVQLLLDPPSANSPLDSAQKVTWLNPPRWRVGKSHGAPDMEILKDLKLKIDQLEQAAEAAEKRLAEKTGREKLQSEHQVYILKRELTEYMLTVYLNEKRQMRDNFSDEEYLFTPDRKISEIGWQLNQLRIKRRIFDYVAKVL